MAGERRQDGRDGKEGSKESGGFSRRKPSAEDDPEWAVTRPRDHKGARTASFAVNQS